MRTSRRTVKHLRANNEARCRRILDRSELLEVEDLDWAQAGAVELDGGMLDTLVYMRMDRRFAALPGFERLRIYRQAATPAAA